MSFDLRASEPNDLLRDIVEELPLRVFWKDLQSRYLGCNALFARDAGCSCADDLIGRTDHELGWREQALAYQADDRAVMTSGEPKIGFEEQQTSPTGELLWLRTSKVPLRNAAGEVIGVLGIYEDITARKAIEGRLRDSERRFQRLFEGSPDPCWIIDTTNRFVLCNHAAAQVLGYDGPQDVVLRHPSELSPERQPDGRASLEKANAMMALAHERGVHRFDWVHRRRDGSVFPVEVTLAQIEMAGEPHLYCVWRDIAERRRFEAVLLETRKRHEEAQRIAGLGHWRLELRTGSLEWSDEVYRIFEIARSDEPLQEDAFFSRIHPEDRQRVSAAYEASVRDHSPYDIEHRIVTPSGRLKWVHERGETVYSPAGEALYSTGTVTDVTARVEANVLLRSSNAFLRELIARAAEGIAVCYAVQGFPFVEFSVWNDRMTEITGYTMAEINRLGWYQTMYPDPELQARAIARMDRMRDGDDLVGEPWQVVTKSGATRTLAITTSLLELADGTPAVIGLMQDVTDVLLAQQERQRLQRQSHAGRRLEAVGRLAGGVAHDFNNMLGVILGCAELALQTIGSGEAGYAELKEIQDAVRRSAELTKQLLAFASQQVTVPVVLDLNAKVSGMLRMLRRLIGEDIRLEWVAADGLWPIRMDPSQIDQILANLCVNARDAIAGVGTVRITTSNVTIEQESMPRSAVPPGCYALLTFEDDGCGMPPEVLDHVFEPFFTTKGVGRGTGLGLATIYGIVRQNGGHIDAASQEGHGTRFRVYLPALAAHTVPDATPSLPAIEMGRGETVLLVEDETGVMRITSRQLERLGYVVLPAMSAAAAEDLADRHPGEIDLLITDVVMPECNGRELARRLVIRRPGLRTLFMSGYAAGTLADGGVLEPGTRLLAKPFNREALAQAVRSALAMA